MESPEDQRARDLKRCSKGKHDVVYPVFLDADLGGIIAWRCACGATSDWRCAYEPAPADTTPVAGSDGYDNPPLQLSPESYEAWLARLRGEDTGD